MLTSDFDNLLVAIEAEYAMVMIKPKSMRDPRKSKMLDHRNREKGNRRDHYNKRVPMQYRRALLCAEEEILYAKDLLKPPSGIKRNKPRQHKMSYQGPKPRIVLVPRTFVCIRNDEDMDIRTEKAKIAKWQDAQKLRRSLANGYNPPAETPIEIQIYTMI